MDGCLDSSDSISQLQHQKGFRMSRSGHDLHPRTKRSATRLRPRVEGLEDRVVLSTFQVNTTLDTVAVNLKNGKDASGHISLRSAIMAANAKPNSRHDHRSQRHVHADDPGYRRGQRRHRRPGHQGQSHDQGKGATKTIIDGNDMDRVIQVLSGKVSISGVTIQHGLADGRRGRDLELRGQGDAHLGHDPGQPGLRSRSSWYQRCRRPQRRQRRRRWRHRCERRHGRGGGIFNAAGSLRIQEPDHVQRGVRRSSAGPAAWGA